MSVMSHMHHTLLQLPRTRKSHWCISPVCTRSDMELTGAVGNFRGRGGYQWQLGNRWEIEKFWYSRLVIEILVYCIEFRQSSSLLFLGKKSLQACHLHFFKRDISVWIFIKKCVSQIRFISCGEQRLDILYENKFPLFQNAAIDKLCIEVGEGRYPVNSIQRIITDWRNLDVRIQLFVGLMT